MISAAEVLLTVGCGGEGSEVYAGLCFSTLCKCSVAYKRRPTTRFLAICKWLDEFAE